MLKLLVSVEDFCVQKIIATAEVVGVSVEIEKGVSPEALELLDPKARSLLLQTSHGFISQHNAILRYLAEISPFAQISGVSNFNAALVDQWLEFSWHEIGETYSL